MGRSLVALTTLVGGLGLGFALGYVILIVAAFLPGGERITMFMVGADDQEIGFGFTLVVVPYFLLMLHLVLRIRLGAVLLKLGDVDLAQHFAARRLTVNPLRGRREALANRTVLIRVALRHQSYPQAEELAADAQLPRGSAFGAARLKADFQRWRLEAALRREDLILAAEIVDQAWPVHGRGPESASFCACAGELAVRNGDSEAWAQWRERAVYAASKSARLKIVEAFAARKFRLADVDAAELCDELEGVAPEWLADVPGAHGEVVAVRAALLDQGGRSAEAVAALSRSGAADARSIFVIERVRESIASG